MPHIDDPFRGAFDDIMRRLGDLESSSPLGNTSVTHGQTKFIGEHSLLIDGSGDVVGVLFVQGEIDGDGQFTWSGPVNISGPTNIAGLLEISGVFSVTSPTVAMSSAIVFVGSLVSAGSVSAASLTANGPALFTGTVTNSNYALTTSPANTFLTSGGLLSRVTSAARYKIDPQEMDLPDELLDVPVRSWIDLAAAEQFAALYTAPRPFTREQQRAFDDVSLRRVPGVIAEEVEAAGGGAFVDYDEDGTVRGVYYDRLWGGQIAVLNRQHREDAKRIDDLELVVKKLTDRLDSLSG
jgi:hypothetical protein